MPRIVVEDGPSFVAVAGTKLVLAIEDAGVDILHRCGGHARCTTCRVEILEGAVSAMESLEKDRLAKETDLPANTRLSCQTRITADGDVKVRVIKRTSDAGQAAGDRPADD